MTPKKCMSIAKSLTDTQHMELEPLCSAHVLNNCKQNEIEKEATVIYVSTTYKVCY